MIKATVVVEEEANAGNRDTVRGRQSFGLKSGEAQKKKARMLIFLPNDTLCALDS
jgi:hypothetical protein